MSIYKVEAIFDEGAYMESFMDYEAALEWAEDMHRRGYSVIVYKNGDIWCEYEH